MIVRRSMALTLKIPCYISLLGLFWLTWIGCRSKESSLAVEPGGNGSALVEVSKDKGQDSTLSTDQHAHIPGAHGGTIVAIGSDSYHAEALVESNGTLRLLMLGQDETRIQEVEVQTLKGFLKTTGESESVAFDLNSTPQDGDSTGKTSQFTGKLPDSYVGKPIDVTIPNLKINGERFRIGFSTATTSHSGHSGDMPMVANSALDPDLYRTPGGKYTAQDIEANGKLTAAQKFKGIRSTHDMKPVDGDRICPITQTKANPAFTWIVDGKPYQFCCPPCVDEFVKMAKQEPDKVKEPDAYIK